MKKILIFFLKLAISILLVGYIFSKTDLRAIGATLCGANIWLVLLALSLHLIGFTISAFRWKLLLRVQGVEARASRLFLSYIVGQFFSFFLPSTVGGDLFRVYDTRGISQGAARSAIVIFIERLTGLFALLSIACLGALVGGRWVGRIPEIFGIIFLFLLVIIFLLVIFINKKTAGFFHYLGGLKFFPEKIKNIFGQVGEVVANFRRSPRAFALPLFLAFLLQVNVAIHIWIISRAVHMQLPLVYFLVIVPVVQVLLMVPVSIGGLGLSENIYAFFLGKLGVPIPQAVALSLISFGLRLLIGVSGAVIYNVKKS